MDLVLDIIPFTQIQSWTTGCSLLVLFRHTPVYDHEQWDTDLCLYVYLTVEPALFQRSAQ